MDKYLTILKKHALFKDLDSDSIEKLLICLNGKVKKYSRGEVILHTGMDIFNIGIVLEGTAQAVMNDELGRKKVTTTLHPNDLFGEAMVCAGIEKSLVTITASTDISIVYIDYLNFTDRCGKLCKEHLIFVNNLLSLIAQKNLNLTRRIDLICLKSLREKIAVFLLSEARKFGSLTFNINFNRDELAAYLNVDRSALSRELCRMRDEGLIEFWKYSFRIINMEKLRGLNKPKEG